MDIHADHIRIRAAWMYFIEQLTQNEIAAILGIGRVTVVRLLAEARSRNEIKFVIESDLKHYVDLERQMETTFSIPQVLIAPLSQPDADPVTSISAMTGKYISEIMRSGMNVGVGWGRTLFGTLSYISAKMLNDFNVISLLGGVGVARRWNPVEFTWRFAQLFQGDCYLIPAPAVVDSIETKRALIDHCGIDGLFKLADSLDVVLLSVGDITSATTFYRGGYLSETEREQLVSSGAVGDILFHFFNRQGHLVDHPVNELAMSVEVSKLRKAPVRLLASGGREKTYALLGAIKLIAPTTFITDEESARRMLNAHHSR